MKMQEESDLEKYFSTTEAEETPEPVWEDGGEIFIGKFWTLDSVSEKSSFSKKNHKKYLIDVYITIIEKNQNFIQIDKIFSQTIQIS